MCEPDSYTCNSKFVFLWCIISGNSSTENLEIRVSSELISGIHDIEVLCSIKNPEHFRKVSVIGLQRFNKTRNYLTPVVFVTDGDRISWHNTDLRDRPGVKVVANIRDVNSAFLKFTIARDWVQFPDDDVTFACYLGGRTKENNTVDTQWTEEVGVAMKGKSVYYHLRVCPCKVSIVHLRKCSVKGA
jgi:hypothetical protein